MCKVLKVEFLTPFENKEIGRERLEKITSTKSENNPPPRYQMDFIICFQPNGRGIKLNHFKIKNGNK